MRRLSTLLAMLALALGMEAAAARGLKITQIDGRVTERNYPRLEKLMAAQVDRVVGLKIIVKKSGIDDRLSAEADADGQFVMYRSGRARSEIIANEGYALRHGDYVLDGFFLVKHGGLHQGIVSYALEPVDETKVRLNPAVQIIPVKLN